MLSKGISGKAPVSLGGKFNYIFILIESLDGFSLLFWSITSDTFLEGNKLRN